MADDDSTNSTDDAESDDDGAGSATETGQGDGGQAEVPPEVRRALSKANREAEGLRRKLKAFEDRDKTAAQLLEERAATAERAAADAQSQLLRYEIAADKGLPAELAGRLQGSNAKELAADADKLLELVGKAGGGGGAPKFNGGPRKTAEGKTDMNALIRSTAGLG